MNPNLYFCVLQNHLILSKVIQRWTIAPKICWRRKYGKIKEKAGMLREPMEDKREPAKTRIDPHQHLALRSLNVFVSLLLATEELIEMKQSSVCLLAHQICCKICWFLLLLNYWVSCLPDSKENPLQRRALSKFCWSSLFLKKGNIKLRL